MSQESDRDILIELRTKVGDIHFNMTQPGGKVPQLEATVDEHSARLNQADGARKMLVWIITGACGAILALATVLLTHLLRGK